DVELEQRVAVVDLERPAGGDVRSLKRLRDQAGMAAERDLARCRWVLVRVHRVPAVELEVETLGRPGDDEGVEAAVDDRDVDRVDAREVVAADRGEQRLAVATGEN